MTNLIGVDPYDVLRLTLVRTMARSPRSRQLLVQARKRLPIPSRLWGIDHYVMAKTAGCALSVLARRGEVGAIADTLDALRATGGALGEGRYGYEFDVQTRWAFYPAGSPNLISTVFVARGLGAAGIAVGDAALCVEMAASARFLRESLSADGACPYFRYTLTSDRLVHNANLLGAGLVAMDAALRGDSEALESARSAALTTARAQREDGSWPYGEGPSLGWSDNFHTAYNLDGLLQVWLASGDPAIHASLDRGIVHWIRDFFGPVGEPKYYPYKPSPYDIHSAGTAVDIAARLATWGWDTGELAEKVAQWTRRNLVDPSTGTTYYQKHRLWTDRRHFVRWGDAHWALGTSALSLLHEGRKDPLEEAVAAASGVVKHAS